MDVHLDPQSALLVERHLRAGRYGSPEEVVARALEVLTQEASGSAEGERRQAVQNMLEFARKHQFTLGESLRIRDLVHEGHRY